MKELIKALDQAVHQENWHAALFIALSLPDICGKLESNRESVSERYSRWFNSHLRDYYVKKVGARKDEVTFMHASDCYALRCALLHEGSDEIHTQKAKTVLERFIFSSTLPHLLLLNNRILVLNVREFCTEMSGAVKKWLNETELGVEIIKIHSSSALNF